MILSLIHYRILSLHDGLINYRLRCLRWRNLRHNWWQSIWTRILSWPTSTTRSWNSYFLWVLSLSLPFSPSRTWLSNAIIIHKRSNIRNRKSSSPISTKRCVWLFNSLFIPSYKLAPHVLTIIFFVVFIHMFALILFIHQSSLFVTHIAVSDQHNIGITFTIILILRKVCFCIGIHH